MNPETANQPQADVSATLDNQALLGTEPDLADLAEESPDTSASEAGAEPGAEVEDQSAAAEEQTEQPPSIQERLKDLTQREADEYRDRYPNAWKRLLDPAVTEDDKHLLLDKIETDKEIARLRAQEEYWQTLQEEPTPEESEPEVPAPVLDPTEARKQYYERIDNVVGSMLDNQSVQQLGMDVLSNLGVDFSKMDDPKLAPQDRAELQALAQNAPKLGRTLARAGTDLIATLLPKMVSEALEMAMPGSGRAYERQVYAMQWEQVRGQADASGRPLYGNLPEYGSKEFRQATRAAAQQFPGFDDIVFKGKNGMPLPLHEQAAKKYEILAKAMAGQKVSPAVVAQAVQTGKKLASQADRKRQAGRALGAGQTTNRASFVKPAGTDGEDDPVMAALDAEIQRTNQDIRPVSRFTRR